MKEAVCRDERNRSVLWPSREQGSQKPRERALTHSDTSRNTDHVRNTLQVGPEKLCGVCAQRRRHLDVEVQQPADREMHRGDLVEVDGIVEAAEPAPDRPRRGGAVPKLSELPTLHDRSADIGPRSLSTSGRG